MDPVSVAFGSIAFIETVLRSYDKAQALIRNVKSFDADRETIAAKISAEKTITLQVRDLLFSRIPTSEDRSLFEQLPDSAQRSIYLIFHQYEKAIRSYLPLEDVYELADATDRGVALLSRSMAQLALSRHPAATLDAKDRTQNWFTNLSWARRDKKRLLVLHQEFEVWNNKVTRIVEHHVLLQNQVRSTSTQSFDPCSMNEAVSLGIAEAVALQSTALLPIDSSTPARTTGIVLTEFRRPWSDVKGLRRLEAHSSFELGRIDEHSVILDSRRYGSILNKEQREISCDRLNQLTSILQSLHKLEDIIPQCLCWVERPDHGEFSLVFQIDAALEKRPISLLGMLPAVSQASGPLLDTRFQIAHRLARTIARLHDLSWLHKNIRSDNMLFYHHAEGQEHVREDGSPMLPRRWMLYGFEYSRPLDGKTSLQADGVLERNIYRHPQRWGVPTADFSPAHDWYALGVVLLELGLWRKALSLLKISNVADPTQVKSALVARAQSHLGYTAGSSYRNIVISCLQGKVECEDDDQIIHAGKNAARFRTVILDQLARLAFPDLLASYSAVEDHPAGSDPTDDDFDVSMAS